MIPVTKEQASAIEKTAGFGTVLVQEAGNLGRYVGRVLGTVPQDAVGAILGEPLRYVRTRIAAQVDEKISQIHKARNVTETEAVSPSLAIPLLQAAYDESNEDLQNLWASLIAAAMDPLRSNRVRKSFIETVKKFDPLDALILQDMYETKKSFGFGIKAPQELAGLLKVTIQEAQLSLDNLVILNCLVRSSTVSLSTYGMELIRACSS